MNQGLQRRLLPTLQRFNKNRWPSLPAYLLEIVDNVSSSGSGSGIAVPSHTRSSLKGNNVSKLYEYFKYFFNNSWNFCVSPRACYFFYILFYTSLSLSLYIYIYIYIHTHTHTRHCVCIIDHYMRVCTYVHLHRKPLHPHSFSWSDYGSVWSVPCSRHYMDLSSSPPVKT